MWISQLTKGLVMYGGKGGGISLVGGGSILLPNTGGHPVLAIIAFASIAIGGAMLAVTFSTWLAKKIYSR